MTHTRTIFCTKPVSIILHFNVTLTTEIRKFWISFSKETKHIRQNLNDITLRYDFVTKFRRNGWNEIYHFRWFDFSTYGSFHHRLIDTSSTSLLFLCLLKKQSQIFFRKAYFCLCLVPASSCFEWVIVTSSMMHILSEEFWNKKKTVKKFHYQTTPFSLGP